MNGQVIQLQHGQATVTVNGRSATLTLDGTTLTFSDGQSTMMTTVGGDSTSQSTINGQTVTITVQGHNVTISTGSKAKMIGKMIGNDILSLPLHPDN